MRVVLRRQGSEVRTDERSEDRPKVHPLGRAIFSYCSMPYVASSFPAMDMVFGIV